MKGTNLLFLGLLALPLAIPADGARADDKKATKDEGKAEDVKKADRMLTQAILKADTDTFDALTSDEYFLTTSNGKVLEKRKNVAALKEGTLSFTSIDDSDVKATLYGNTAVVTGLSAMKGKWKQKEFDDEYRWTRVYVRRQNKWLCVTEHISHVWKPDATEKAK